MLIPILSIITATLAISTASIFIRFADAPPLAITFYRLTLSTLFLSVFMLKKDNQKDLLKLKKGDIFLIILSGFFLSLHFITWITSLFYTSVASSVVFVSTHPIWVAVLSPFTTKDKITKIALLGISAATMGAIIIGWGDFEIGKKALIGDILALLGSLSLTFYVLIGRNIRQKTSLVPYTVLCYGSAAIITLIFVLYNNIKLFGYSKFTYLMFLCITLVPQILGHTLYNYSLKFFPAHIVATTFLGEPIFSSLLAYLIFKETITPVKLIGITLILTGIYVVAKEETKNG